MDWLIVLILALCFVSFIAVWWFFMYMKQRSMMKLAQCPMCRNKSDFSKWEYFHYHDSNKSDYGVYYECPNCNTYTEYNKINFDI